MKELIKNRILRAIEQKVFPGCVVGIIRKNGERIVLPFGRFTYEEEAKPVKKDTIFDVASITKSNHTSCLALKLIDEGRLKLEDRLIKFVPEFRNSDRENVLIKHLLTQTLAFDHRVSLSSSKDKTPDEILEVIFTTEFENKPGRRYFYLNATSILLGLVVERIFAKKLDELAEEIFFNPLQMRRTTFFPLKKFEKDEIMPTEIDNWRGRIIQGEVHDESAFTLQSKLIVGSAGLFTTVPDLLNFLEMLLNKGELDRKKYFSPEMVELMHTNQLELIGGKIGLGWELCQPRYMGQYCTPKTFGKTGFTGCCCLCDISKEVGIVLLSNYTFPKRKPDATLINQVRRDIADIVFKNL